MAVVVAAVEGMPAAAVVEESPAVVEGRPVAAAAERMPVAVA